MTLASCFKKPVRDFWLLSRTTWISNRRDFLLFSRDRLARSLILGAIAVSFVVGVFGLCLFVFAILLSLGDRAGWEAMHRLAEYGLAIIFCMMLYSSLLTTLHALFSDRTLLLLWSSPIGWAGLWWNRVFLILQKSGWMVAGFVLPVLVALGVAAGSPLSYYLCIPVVLLALGILPCALGTGLGLLLVYFLPPRRLQQALLFFGLLVGMLGVVAFQQLRLERVLREGDAVALSQELLTLRPLPPPLGLPLRWAGDALLSGAETGSLPGASLFGLLATDLLSLVMLHFLGRALFFASWSRNLAAPDLRLGRRLSGGEKWLSGLPWPDLGNPLLRKDIRIFFRELEQWSSLVMVLPLLVLCVTNMRVIFAQVSSPQAILGWINLVMCGLVVAGVGARVLYPCFSVEGPAFWNTLVSPLHLSRLLWTKFFFYSLPLVGTALLLTAANSLLFHVSGVLWRLSLFTSGLSAVTLCSIGVAFAAAYPHFQYRQISQVVLSMGGLYYMLASCAYVAAVGILWCLPFLQQIPDARSVLGGYAQLAAGPWLYAGVVLSAGIIAASMASAHRSLRRLEWKG